MMESRGETEDLWNLIQQNQESLLRIATAATHLLHSLVEVSKSISTQPLPSSVYAHFKQTIQNSHILTNTIQDYDLQYNEYQAQREDLTDELRQSLQELSLGKYEQSRNQITGRQSQLEEEIAILKQQLDNNNRDFQDQIGVYNQHLFGLKQALAEAEEKLSRTEEQQLVIDDLQNRLVVLREEKERDSMLIDMARKIRFFERERGGRQAFLSPTSLPDSARTIRSNLGTFKNK